MKVEIQEGFPTTEILVRCLEMTDEIRSIVSLLETGTRKVFGRKDGKTYLIDPREVLYFEALNRRCFIYTDKDIYETYL